MARTPYGSSANCKPLPSYLPDAYFVCENKDYRVQAMTMP